MNQSTSFAQVANNQSISLSSALRANTPPTKGQTPSRKFLTLSIFFLLSIFCTTTAWGAEESLQCPAGTISNNTMTWNLTSCTIVHAKGSNNNYAAYSPWRVYQGAIVTFTPKSNTTISKIVITAGSSAVSSLLPSRSSSPSAGVSYVTAYSVSASPTLPTKV